jgi:hypothetical protein
MGNALFHTRTTQAQHRLHQRHLAISNGFNQFQSNFIHQERLLIEEQLSQLYILASHHLSETDLKQAAEIAVLCQFTLKEMKKMYQIFSRISSTTERYTTIHEISLYFNVRRTVLLETCLSHVFPQKERLSLPDFMLTMMAFCTCDHHELIHVLTEYCAARNESSLEAVLVAVLGAPLKGNIEALLGVLSTLDTVSIDVTLFNRALQRPCANVEKLVELNDIYPSLLYPSFKLQAILREKCLGNSFWDRVRNVVSDIGVVGMFSYQDFQQCQLNYYNENLHRLRTDVMLKSSCSALIPGFLKPKPNQAQRLDVIMKR